MSQPNKHDNADKKPISDPIAELIKSVYPDMPIENMTDEEIMDEIEDRNFKHREEQQPEE